MHACCVCVCVCEDCVVVDVVCIDLAVSSITVRAGIVFLFQEQKDYNNYNTYYNIAALA